MQYNVNCQFEARILPGVTRSQIEDALEPVLALLGEGLGSEENSDRSADLWFDGHSTVASINAYVGHDFPAAFAAACTALGRLASLPFYATLSDEDGNCPGAALLEVQYGPPAPAPST